jgi:hypothetical protein
MLDTAAKAIAKFFEDRPALSLIMVILTAVFATIIGVSLLEKSKPTYQVTVVYCDSRPPKTIIVRTRRIPNNSHILTYKLAAPVFDSEINVCDIQNVTLISE